MDGYNYINQDMWWENENLGQHYYYNDDQYDDDCWWTSNSAQNQHDESLCFPEDQESNESSFSKKLDQMIEILNETFNKEEDISKINFRD